MSDDARKPSPDRSPRCKSRWRLTWFDVANLALIFLVLDFKPFSHLFGLETFERQHGDWPEICLLVVAQIVFDVAYRWTFRRPSLRTEFASVKEDVRQGRLKRMPLAARCAFLLTMLALVCLGWYAQPPYGPRILAASVPLFLLFAAIELNCVLHPGDSVLPDPKDELLMFFRARMLKVGYVTAILALTALYLASLWGSRWVGLILPVVLTISLLVPAFVYRRLDRLAEIDG